MSLKAFILWVLFWLPLCFAAWYFSSILFVVPFAAALDSLSTTLLPHIVSAVEPEGNALAVVLTLEVGIEGAGAPGQSQLFIGQGEMLFEINPLIYGYCVPLYTALLLASPGTDGRKLVSWLNAMAILFLVQVLCLQTHIFKGIAIDLAGETQALLGYPAWGYELIAIFYQLCYLILPGVVPIGIWLVQFRSSVMGLASEPSATDAVERERTFR